MEPSSRDFGWTTAAAALGFGLVQLDVTIVNVALPAMANTLGSHVSQLQWVGDAYALAFAASLLSAGFIGDRYGEENVYLSGLALFAVASLGCGLAPTASLLIVARALQGLAAAAILPCSLALINHAARDAKSRAGAIAWWTATGSIMLALGPIVGGLILGVTSWRSIFLVNLPICIVGALLTFRVRETSRQTKDHGALDLTGQFLAVVALSGMTGAMIEAKPLGFNSVWIGLAAAGLLAAVAFIWVEARSKAPMLSLALFSDRNFSAATVDGAAVNLTLYGAIFVFSLYLQRVLGYDPIQTGLAYLPLSATLFFANMVSGRWVGRTGPRVPMALGAAIDAAGFIWLLFVGANSSYWLLWPAFVLIAAGMGLGVPAMSIAVLSSVHKERSGIASAVLNAARQAGGAFGVALFGALAGDGRGRVVVGLHQSSFIAVGAACINRHSRVFCNQAFSKLMFRAVPADVLHRVRNGRHAPHVPYEQLN